MTLPAYDPRRPLVPGTWLIEASAGTGKTHAITDLVLRLVAEEGLRLEEILVVTFTQAATAELRERVRGRLVHALRALAPGGSRAPEADDAVLAGLCASAEPHALRVRLRAALEDFDAAAISTIHGFCQRMQTLHAFESQVAFDQQLVEDPAALLAELTDDWLSRTFAASDARRTSFLLTACGLGRRALHELARAVVSHPTAALAPAPPARDPRVDWEEARERFARGWGAGGRAELAALFAADRALKKGLLNRRIYKAGQTERYADRLDAWLAEGGMPDGVDFRRAAWVRYFTAAQAAPLCHPLLDAWQELVERAAPLLQSPWLEFAHWIRAELPRRLEAQGLLTFEDLLTRLRDRLDRPELVQALRRRFRAALIDEFQDTDAVQWDIFRTLFAHSPEHRLFLIGDPKQAIYAFRGADVFVYREARATARTDAQFTLPVNHRSDADYLDGIGRLFGPPEDFHPEGPFDLRFIDLPAVQATAAHAGWGLRFPGGRPAALAAPLNLRLFDHGSPPGPAASTWTKTELAAAVPGWLADDVTATLRAGGELREGDGWRPLGPRDLAVLVRTNRQAHDVQAALRLRGVPAVLSQAGSVLMTEEALALERWLAAVASPGRDSPARALAVTQLYGFTADELVPGRGGQAGRFADWLESLAGWAQMLERGELTRALRAAVEEPWRAGEPSALERLLGLVDGERRATDLRHALELIQTAAAREHLGPAGLLAWLRQRRERADLEPEECALRLESEAQAVSIVTLHKAKGLQYPVVFLPYAWDGRLQTAGSGGACLVHEPAESTALLLDLSRDPDDPLYQQRLARASAEALQEALRLLYVGLTRARHAAVVTWGLARQDAETAALGVLLHGRARHGDPAERPVVRAARRIRAALAEGGDDAGLRADLEALCSPGAGGTRPLAWSWIRPAAAPTPVRPRAASGEEGPLTTRRLGRTFDRTFRQSSYTSLAAAAEGEATPPFTAAPDADVDYGAPDAPVADQLPGGREAGRWVHKVLEELDFPVLRERADRPGSLGRPLEELCAALGRRLGFPDPAAHGALARRLKEALATPLAAPGEPLAGVRLGGLSLGDRLDELRFELPVAGGAAWRPGQRTVDGAALAGLIARPDGPWPADYARRLAALRLPALAGFLTGAIDLVFRVPGPEGPRYYLADYKTNRVGPGRDALLAEMARHHYPLQYHLYLVALHRYLRWRLGPTYDYERCIGGCAYLFLRAMDGRPGAGVLLDRPPREVIAGLSRALGEPGGDPG